MQQPRAAFDKLQPAVAQEGHLAERLMRQVIGLAALEGDGSHIMGEPRFLGRTSQPEVAHEATHLFGHLQDNAMNRAPSCGPKDTEKPIWRKARRST